jgi:hypothetical protein
LNIINISLIQMLIYGHLLISWSWFIMLREFNWIYNTYGDWIIINFILLKCHNLNTYCGKAFTTIYSMSMNWIWHIWIRDLFSMMKLISVCQWGSLYVLGTLKKISLMQSYLFMDI